MQRSSLDAVWIARWLALGGIAFLLAACTAMGPVQPVAAPGTGAVVNMTTLLNYAPNTVTVRAGETVEWRNTSIMTHTVTAEASLASNRSYVSLPRGARAFNSGDVPPGGVFRHRFTVPGVYQYFCIPHQNNGMRGTVVVN